MDLYNKLSNFPIIHGRAVCGYVLYNNFPPIPEISVSDDLHIVTVVDKSSMNSNSIDKIRFKKGKINYIIIDEYKKWISKIEELKNYIEFNYNDLPKYILYLDSFDTLILKDILHPQEYLDYYKCKVLFNAEPAYHHTGFPGPEGTGNDYYDSLYYGGRDEYMKLNNEKYGYPLDNSLNAGVFIGEKDYILSLLKEIYNIMKDDHDKGFPYGCQDDQCVLRYLNNKHFDNISTDIFSLFAFWGCPELFKQPNSIYSIDYFKKYKHEYDNRMVSL
jgi:hypothetical protein